MYAIVKNGGRQLKIREGDTVLVDAADLSPGEEFVFDEVLLFSDESGDVRVGTPLVDTVTVAGTVAGTASGPKITVFKYRRRKSSQTKTGHRQKYSQVKVQSITASAPQAGTKVRGQHGEQETEAAPTGSATED
jgi:large subunit ribosomal protein L21